MREAMPVSKADARFWKTSYSQEKSDAVDSRGDTLIREAMPVSKIDA